MDKSFMIRFDFPLEASSSTVIAIEARAALHHSEPYYVIDSFQFAGSKKVNSISLLPTQEIKLLRAHGRDLWVHKDSERTSQLSLSIGKAIEESDDFIMQ